MARFFATLMETYHPPEGELQYVYVYIYILYVYIYIYTYIHKLSSIIAGFGTAECIVVLAIFVDFALENCQQLMASSIRDRNLTPYLLSGSWICHPSFNWNYVVPCPVDSEVPSVQSWLPMDAFELCRQPQHPFLSLVHGLNRVLKAVLAQCQQVSTLQNLTRTLSLYKK